MENIIIGLKNNKSIKVTKFTNYYGCVDRTYLQTVIFNTRTPHSRKRKQRRND